MHDLTVSEVKDAAESNNVHSRRVGCIVLRPPVPLVDRTTKEVVHADAVDISGKYPNTVHIAERGFWWDTNQFTLGYRA